MKEMPLLIQITVRHKVSLHSLLLNTADLEANVPLLGAMFTEAQITLV